MHPASKSLENCRFLIIATAADGASNRHLVGFPSPPCSPKGTRRSPVPPVGASSFSLHWFSPSLAPSGSQAPIAELSSETRRALPIYSANRGSIRSRITWTASATVRTLMRGSRHPMPLPRMARTLARVRIFVLRSRRASVVTPLATCEALSAAAEEVNHG
jgi:hypothetical protein